MNDNPRPAPRRIRSGKSANNQPTEPQGERLAKLLAHQIPCSRREAELYIENGHVLVNGRVVMEPGFRVRNEAITLTPDASLEPIPSVTFVLHLGVDFTPRSPHPISNASHWREDASPTRWHNKHLNELQTFAPLEDRASGLIVLTQDWRVARKLHEDASVLEHEFTVEVSSPVSEEDLNHLNKTLDLRPWGLSALKVSVSSNTEAITRLRVALKGYQTGVLGALCQHMNWRLHNIKRLRLGRVSLAGLPAGQWRYLQEFERF